MCLPDEKLEETNLNLEFGYDEKQLKQYLLDYLQSHNMHQSLKALEIAVQMHQKQLRREGIPYIIHPLTMACHALAVGVKEDNLIAVILLHDVCEDCPVQAEQLPVNECVRQGVRYMTYAPLEDESGDEAKTRYYREMRESREACLAKLFDRCHNISSMTRAFSRKKMQSYIEETRKYVYPLMEDTRKMYPEFLCAVYVLEYHMKSVIEAIEKLL